MIWKLWLLFDCGSTAVILNSESTGTVCFLLSNAFRVLHPLPRNILPEMLAVSNGFVYLLSSYPWLLGKYGMTYPEMFLAIS